MKTNSADTIKINIAFPIKLSVAVFVIALGLDFFYYWITKSLENTLIFTAATTAAAGTVLAAFYSARVLSLQLQQDTRSRNESLIANKLKQKENAMSLASRWTDPHMQAARKTCRDIADLRGHSLEKKRNSEL